MILHWGIPDDTLGLEVRSAEHIVAFDAVTVPDDWIAQAKRPAVETAVLDVLATHGNPVMQTDFIHIPVVSWVLVAERL